MKPGPWTISESEAAAREDEVLAGFKAEKARLAGDAPVVIERLTRGYGHEAVRQAMEIAILREFAARFRKVQP